MILVTAATAPVGRSIVEQLVELSQPVRALTRGGGSQNAAGLPAATEIAEGDLAEPASLARAFAGVESVFLLAVVPGFIEAFLDAARAAGVRRIVFQSSGAVADGVDRQPNDIAALHHDIEQAIRASGLRWTFLRLDVASADALQWAFDVPGQLRVGDTVRGPYADAAGSPLHAADLAAVAVAALMSPEHDGQVYRLTGPQSLTHAEQIELIGRAHGRSLRFEELDEAAARAAISPFAPAELLFDTWQQYRGVPAPVADTVERIIGRAPRTGSEWAADYPI